MRLKTFYAKTMTEAMQMVREALGDEAIIIATGEERARGCVRVTAAIEPAFEIGNDGVAGASSWLQYDEEQDSDTVSEELTDVMLRHNVPEDVMDHIISCATVMGFGDVKTALLATLEQLFSFSPLPTGAYKKPIMMVGPPGSGKTLAVAKFAARGAMNGLNVGVISTDTFRAGGVEQLQAFTNLLKIDLKKAKNPHDLKSLSHDLSQKMDQVIIDTSGFNPFLVDDIKTLAKLISSTDIRPILVIPAGFDTDEAGEMARVFAAIGVGEILPTRLDIARRKGNILAAAHYGGMSFSDFSNTPKVAQGLSPLTPKTLSNILIPHLYQSEKRGIVQSITLEQGTKKTGTRQ